MQVFGDINFEYKQLEQLPWKDEVIIERMYGNLNLNFNNLKDFKGFPKYLMGDLEILGNKFENFDDFPLEINGNLFINFDLDEELRKRVKKNIVCDFFE